MEDRDRLLREKPFKFVGGHNEERDWRVTQDGHVLHFTPVALFSRPFMAAPPRPRGGSG